MRFSSILGRAHRLTLSFLVVGALMSLGLYYFWQHNENWFTFTISLLTFFAVIATALQFQQSAKISESMSTQYIGQFPNNMAAILDLLNSASRSLVIVTDTAGYGHFSSPKLFEAYRAKLHELSAEGVTVEVAVYDETRYTEANRAQLDKMSASYEVFLRGTTFQNYAKWKPKKATKMREGHEAFYEVLRESESEFLRQYQDNGIRVSRTDRHLPMYMWICDAERAIFCFVVSEGGEDLEYAFTTRDGNLIKALITMAHGYFPPDAQPCVRRFPVAKDDAGHAGPTKEVLDRVSTDGH